MSDRIDLDATETNADWLRPSKADRRQPRLHGERDERKAQQAGQPMPYADDTDAEQDAEDAEEPA